MGNVPEVDNQKKAIIIGAGPAGLTAAYELLDRTDIKPIVFEASGDIGGISKTVNYKGNRIDIGGHRFFSKSTRVMDWWNKILPEDMLERNRLSRIFFLRKFFDYPISLSLNTFMNLGVVRVAKVGFSYVKIRLLPIKEEKSLEDFFINRFGRELYKTFFKDYTEKLWGISCRDISPEWGAQRVKGLSVSKAIVHAVKSIFSKKSSAMQKDVETSLIDRFLYPKFGPGQMWEEVAKIVKEKGGEIYMNQEVSGLKVESGKVRAVKVGGEWVKGDYFFSTMPVRDLILGTEGNVPKDVREVAEGLVYRDFITAGLLVEKLKTESGTVPDNWIYIQEKDVKLGRLQIFNNWSPYMVKDKNKVWVGLEYFCSEGDEMWNMSEEDFSKLAIDELAKIDFIDKKDVVDSVVIKMKKAYPAYFGSYDNFQVIRDFVDGIDNLFLVGRNGMHRYNNQDHSMLTAMMAVDNIKEGIKDKSNLWDVNAEEEYHEEK